jgi:pyridoxine 4-dehydrogenase
VQNQYNPWSRQPEFDGVLEYCDREKLTFLPWGPLGGTRHQGQITQTSVLSQLAQEKGVSVYSLVLAWLRTKSPQIIPIPGTSKVENLVDCLRAIDISLTATEVNQIDQATAT